MKYQKRSKKTVLSIQRLLHVILNPAAVREVPAAVAAEETPAAQADIFNLNRVFCEILKE